jgi:hypothetical protein
VDHDPGPTALDFTCSGLSYDTHTGTDFALPSLAAMRAGVAVLAAAPGQVTALRDGMPDTGLTPETAAQIEGRDCGNGVVIRHADGWETQYCHLMQGSVTVARGQIVETGTPLGLVGLSGNTEFPHVHIALRRNGQVVDPFDPDGQITCGAPDPETRRQELVSDYEEKFNNPYVAAARGLIDDVIEPRDTRRILIRALEGREITVYGDGGQVRDLLPVADAVAAWRAVLAGIDRRARRAFNLGGGSANAVSLAGVPAEIARLAPVPPVVHRAPWRAGDLPWFVADTAAQSAATGRQPRTGWREGVGHLARWLAEHRITAPVPAAPEPQRARA